MYVGQMQPSVSETWLIDRNTNSFMRESITFSPALVKVSLRDCFTDVLSQDSLLKSSSTASLTNFVTLDLIRYSTKFW